MGTWILVLMITSSQGNAIAIPPYVYDNIMSCKDAKAKYEETDHGLIDTYKLKAVCIPAPVNATNK